MKWEYYVVHLNVDETPNKSPEASCEPPKAADSTPGPLRTPPRRIQRVVPTIPTAANRTVVGNCFTEVEKC